MMDSSIFIAALGAVIIALYLSLFKRLSPVGWAIGITHGLLALITLWGWMHALDMQFAVAMALLTIYFGAMSAAELFYRSRA